MYPVSTELDKVNCLTSLVGIRTACPPGIKQPPFFIEDIEGYDVKKLSNIARSSSMKGVDLGKFIIASAAREMMGDIELLMNSGYTMKNIVGQTCSSCKLLPIYTTNAGIKVKSVVASNYQILQITSLTILANRTGEEEFVIDDGVSPQTFVVNLQAGVLMPVNLDYSTTQKSVDIYFTDPTVPLGQVQCSTVSSCGCGGSVTTNNPIAVSGLLAGNEVSTQYGFLPCAGVSCSYDALVCTMMKQAPNIFGLALLYKIGDKFVVTKSNSERNNEAASFNDSEEELQRNFGVLYWAKMKGAGAKGKGIVHIMNDFLKRSIGDKCVICESKVYTSYTSG